MTLLLLAGLAACDRQSPPKEQAAANAAAQVPPDSEEVQGASESGGQNGSGAFAYSIDRSKAGTPAPDIAFQDPDSGDASLKDFAGKPVLVNLWATWCAPCVAEMPELDKVAAEYSARGLAVLTVSQDIQGQKVIAPFFKQRKLAHLKGWVDPENRLAQHYGAAQLPTTVLYDAQGKEMLRIVGAMDWSSKEGQALLEAAVKS